MDPHKLIMSMPPPSGKSRASFDFESNILGDSKRFRTILCALLRHFGYRWLGAADMKQNVLFWETYVSNLITF